MPNGHDDQKQIETPQTPEVTPEVPTDKSFDFVDLEQEAPQRFSRWFWLQWILLLFIGFGLLGILTGGYENMHRYGWSETGINWALLINKWEKIFALGLLAMLPVSVFLVIAMEDLLADPVRKAMAWWKQAEKSPHFWFCSNNPSPTMKMSTFSKRAFWPTAI